MIAKKGKQNNHSRQNLSHLTFGGLTIIVSTSNLCPSKVQGVNNEQCATLSLTTPNVITPSNSYQNFVVRLK